MSFGPSCPTCQAQSSEVMDSRLSKDMTRRRRMCNHCEERFTTFEKAVAKARPGGRRLSVQRHLVKMDHAVDDLKRRITIIVDELSKEDEE